MMYEMGKNNSKNCVEKDIDKRLESFWRKYDVYTFLVFIF